MKFSIEEIINRHIYARGKSRSDIYDILGINEKALSYRLVDGGNKSFNADEFIKVIEYLALDYYKFLYLYAEDHDGAFGMELIRLNENLHAKANQEVIAYIKKLFDEKEIDSYATKDIDKKLKAEFGSMSYVVDALLPLKNEFGNEYKIYIQKSDKGGAKEGECFIWPPYGECKYLEEYETYLYGQEQKDFLRQYEFIKRVVSNIKYKEQVNMKDLTKIHKNYKDITQKIILKAWDMDYR